ncbi:hypothetical protein ACMATS_31900 [Streptoverticillium reticulum]|uniref:hypothetical protein n=1 Tax=Streptoverticillium reticulum TaxID=1433415 RepID=UPI0039BF85F3
MALTVRAGSATSSPSAGSGTLRSGSRAPTAASSVRMAVTGRRARPVTAQAMAAARAISGGAPATRPRAMVCAASFTSLSTVRA